MEMSEHGGNGDDGLSNLVKIPDRLLRRDKERLQDAEKRKDAKEKPSVTEENSEFFSDAFNTERAAIEELLSSCSGSDRAAAVKTLEEVTTKIQQLQKFLNDSIVFLTQYELKQFQASLQKLKDAGAERREEALPKKKFVFQSRSKAKEKVTGPLAGRPSSSGTDADSGTPADFGNTEVDGSVNPEQCGFSNMNSVTLTKTATEIQKQDVLLSHLTNCKVRLFGSPSTLHIKHVSDCEILCGPVSSSVFVDHCSNSTLALACQQLRTHNTTNTQVYLHVTSRAIIEDCNGVGFAPFSWSYPTLDESFNVSGLDQNRNNWTQVDDFNWLAAGTPSPNWSIIPEVDRKTSWDP
ncbi:tubulin-specific chaperone C [Lampris incognitus]|uniref:tubulin-specific chaperone C n=1 Tax=Lampris incognitus TaxID=2546036 RepID=UPI0024B61C14|nr:tubulin-specific chaperone C [Lampris incognitus]